MSGVPVTTNLSQMAQEGGRRMAARKPTILVVTEDPEPSDAMSAWLRQAGLRVMPAQVHTPRHTPVPGVAAIAARSPWMPMWSSSISGWPATPCCGARPPCSSCPTTGTWERLWWPCNASAALLVPILATVWSWCRGRRPGANCWGPCSTNSQGHKRTPGTCPDSERSP